MEPRRSLTLRWVPATLLAATLVVGGLVTARAIDGTRDERQSRKAAVWLSTATASLHGAIDRAKAAVEVPAEGGGGLAARLAQTKGALASIASVDRSGRLVGSAAPPQSQDAITALLRTPAAQLALEEARDDGTAQLSEALAEGDATTSLVVAARYAPGASISTVSGRRAAIEGYVVGRVDVDAILAPLARTMGGTVTGISVQSDGRELGQNGSLGHGLQVEVAVEIGGQSWMVATAAPNQGGAWPIAIATAAVALAGGVLVATARARREVGRTEALVDARARELTLIGEAGTLLQRSLDLTDILPALAVLLSDALDLAGVSILVADDNGTLVETFSLGRRAGVVPTSVSELRGVPPALAQGEECVLPLERGGRAVGAVWMLSRRAMPPTEMHAVVAIAELTGSAIANAQTFERELETGRQLLELDHLKTEFLGTVSHELRTPIAAIMGFSSILLDRDASLDDDRRRDLLARVACNSQSLGTLVSGLLDFARLERRSLQLEPTVQDLAALVRQVVSQTETLFDEHEVEVDAPAEVLAAVDVSAIERIVSNLLTNAAKFSPPGSPISVSVTRHGEHAELEIIDCGPGIPVDERSRIFSRFYRGTHQLARTTRGVGVGLAVVKELTERLGGTVSVGDGPDAGARFTVSLPAADLSTDPTVERGGRHDAA